MRMFRIAVASLMLAGGSAMAQPPGGFGGPGGGGRGGMMMGGNPEEMFNMLSKGKDVIRRDDVDPMFQRMFDRFAERMNITNGQITREQFRQASEQMQQRMREGGMGGGPGGGGGDMQDRFVEGRFRQMDRNGDGLLSADEMSDTLKAERDKWDKNKDGFIDLNEFKEYVKERFGGGGGNRPADASPAAPNAPTPPPAETPSGIPLPTPELPPDVNRPVVYRYGYLPKELPSWFTEMDIDKDGQVSLSEWAKGAKNLPEFRDVAAEEKFAAMIGKYRGMDANDDGFLTAEEYLRYTKETTLGGPQVAMNRPAPSYSFNRDGGSGNDRGNRGPRGGGGGDNPRGSFGPRGGGGSNGGNSGGGPVENMRGPRGGGPRNDGSGPQAGGGGDRRRGFEKGKGGEGKGGSRG
ncbi:MAG: hypothetical protein K1X57_10505 [Gemmataceae bacterium]|nr:hypothetical protein [Gemmataceae bacterium]